MAILHNSTKIIYHAKIFFIASIKYYIHCTLSNILRTFKHIMRIHVEINVCVLHIKLFFALLNKYLNYNTI